MGRPAKYETPAELDLAINEYLNECQSSSAAPTISGLALRLGFESRQSIYDYKERDDFSYIIKRAVLMIEDYWERKLSEGQSSGSIFWLKNHGWTDKTESELYGPNKKPLEAPIITIVPVAAKD